jgi:hypothetical protein
MLWRSVRSFFWQASAVAGISYWPWHPSSEPPLTIETFFVSEVSAGIFDIEVWEYAVNMCTHTFACFCGPKDAESGNGWSRCSGRNDRKRGIKLGGKRPIPIDIVQPHAENHGRTSFCDGEGGSCHTATRMDLVGRRVVDALMQARLGKNQATAGNGLVRARSTRSEAHDLHKAAAGLGTEDWVGFGADRPGRLISAGYRWFTCRQSF